MNIYKYLIIEINIGYIRGIVTIIGVSVFNNATSHFWYITATVTRVVLPKLPWKTFTLWLISNLSISF